MTRFINFRTLTLVALAGLKVSPLMAQEKSTRPREKSNSVDAKEPLTRLSGLKSLLSPRAAGGPKSSKSAATTTARDKVVVVCGQDDEPQRIAPKSAVPPAPTPKPKSPKPAE